MTNVQKLLGIGCLFLLLGGAWLAFSSSTFIAHDHESMTMNQSMWTCSMHPQILKNKPGKCPLCGMNLIPVKTEPQSKNKSTVSLTLSPEAEALAEVEVSPVLKGFGTQLLHLSGMLMIDETRLETINAWFPGRIDTLFIDYTGIKVNKNSHMASIYSPELRIAQKELVEAVRAQNSRLLDASREKLRLWGLSKSQILEIERSGVVSDVMTLQAPIGGTIIKKYINKGDYIQTGSKIVDIANLDRLWLIADLYESDSSKIAYGQPLEFSLISDPGKTYKGTITFIDPIVNTKTRTIGVRAIVDNSDGELKPGMLADVSVSITYGNLGPIQNKSIKELWVCPMHPEEFSRKQGACLICSMTLKKAGELGLVVDSKNQDMTLLIPDTAPLITGKRSVVYVKDPKVAGRYEGRTIYLGPKLGAFYSVHSGLHEGELVVTKGNFKIDSSMQLQGKPSMMNSSDGAVMTGHNH